MSLFLSQCVCVCVNSETSNLSNLNSWFASNRFGSFGFDCDLPAASKRRIGNVISHICIAYILYYTIWHMYIYCRYNARLSGDCRCLLPCTGRRSVNILLTMFQVGAALYRIYLYTCKAEKRNPCSLRQSLPRRCGRCAQVATPSDKFPIECLQL